MLKRVFDVTVCVATAPITVPVCLFLCVIYFILERESPLFQQVRVGRFENEFKLHKLRTMKRSTAEMGTHNVDISSVTRVGAVLRASKIDELPQLWNVFLGQMSLVGPRPCLLGQKQLIVERRGLSVFSVRPGITGQSQVEGIDMSDPGRLAESDAKYIREMNFFIDLKILIQTALGHGSGDKVKAS